MLRDQQKRNKIVLIIGRKGSGKSFLVKKHLRRLRPFIIVDHLAEYSGFPVYTDLDVFLSDAFTNKLRSCIVRFDSDEDHESLFDFCFSFSPFTLIIEEFNKFVSAHYISPTLERLIRYGRHKAINVIGITQRSFDLPKIITSQVDVWVLFSQVEPRDLDYLEKAIGEPMQILRKLPKGHYILRNI